MNPANSPRPKFKNRSERNEGIQSAASQIFKSGKLLIERPPDMPRNIYRQLRTFQKKLMKNLFRRNPTKNHPMPVRVGYNYHP